MYFVKIFILFFLFLPRTTLAKPHSAQSIAKFDEVVWGFDFISEDELLVTEREGSLYYLNLKTKEKKKLSIPKVRAKGQGGLLDVHFVTFSGKEYVYLTFSEEVEGSFTTSLARGVYKDKKILNLQTLFRAKVYGNTSRHFGSRLIFKENHIFMTVGDRGKRKYAQDISYHNGKILKLTLEGKPAADNPYLKTKGALPEIWSLGHRNPQGIDRDPISGQIYSVEFGPRGGDELNLVKKSMNYGWPVITYGKEYWGPSIGETHKVGMEQPVVYWTPSISPSGMVFYLGEKLKGWKGQLFIACLGGQHLRRLKLDKGKVVEQEKLFEDLDERIRHVRNGPDGLLYFSTDSGKIYQVSQ